MKKTRWWIILVVLLSALIAVCWGFRDAILVHLAPKLVLTDAIANTAAQLEKRMADNPLMMLRSLSGSEGRFTSNLELETSNELLGKIEYDMEIGMDSDPRQISASGMISTAGKQVDMTFMLDGNAALVTSEALLQGKYYGINYDSFSSVIRSNPLLMYVLPEASIAGLEESVLSLQTAMNKDTIQLPDISRQDIRTILTGIMLLDSKVSSESLVFDGRSIPCWAISYYATGEEIRNGTSKLESKDQLMDLTQLKSVTATFWVYEDAVYQVHLIAEMEQTLDLKIVFHADASRDPIWIQWGGTQNGNPANISVEIETEREDSHYKEVWDIAETVGTDKKTLSVSYDWNPDDNQLCVNIRTDGNENAFIIQLFEREDGISLKTEDLDSILMAMDLRKRPFLKDVSCSMTIFKGGPLEPLPAYKGMEDWSVSDFLMMIGSVGSLLGLNIG